MSEPITSTTPTPEMTAPFGPGTQKGPAKNRKNNKAKNNDPSTEEKEQVEQVQRPGGGGAPGTGEMKPTSGIPISPGEGVNEEQQKRSGQTD